MLKRKEERASSISYAMDRFHAILVYNIRANEEEDFLRCKLVHCMYIHRYKGLYNASKRYNSIYDVRKLNDATEFVGTRVCSLALLFFFF